MLGRRLFILTAAASATFPSRSWSQLAPFDLTIKRETNLATVTSVNDCVKGRLFIGQKFYNSPDTAIAGLEFCDTLELPWRNNLNEISCCKPGDYQGKIRTDGHLGWRIEVSGAIARDNIQIHIGNSPKDTVGCIMLGRWSNTQSCFVNGSGGSLAALRLTMQSEQRPIQIKVVA
ncbi:DUF5675 family protein [Rhizobium beringeri]|uniref:DUF5675 family protein n=1 Tax=Rhizobium beringeri TaxID=3019934 RepID=UPI00398EB408